VPVVLLFSLGHQPVAHPLVGFARQGGGASGDGVVGSLPRPVQTQPGFVSPPDLAIGGEPPPAAGRLRRDADQRPVSVFMKQQPPFRESPPASFPPGGFTPGRPMTSTRTKLGSMTKSSAYFAEARRHRQQADAAYLRQLAVPLADAARLPLKTARARVKAMAISAQSPRNGFQDRGG